MRVALALQETPLRQLMTDQKIIEDSDKLTLSKLKLFLKNNPRFKPPSSVTRREAIIDWVVNAINSTGPLASVNTANEVPAPTISTRPANAQYAVLRKLVHSHGL